MTDLWILFLAIAKAGAMTGLLPAIAIAILAEHYRIVRIGIEQVSGRAVSQIPNALSSGNKPAPEVRRVA